MKKNAAPEVRMGYVWKSEGKLYMTYCPECGRENHIHAVNTGRCAWCGYKARERDLR